MKTILIDLNVILDYLRGRRGYDKDVEFMNLCFTGKIQGYVPAHEITTLSYFLEKNIKSHELLVKIIERLLSMLTVIDVTSEILLGALHSSITDYEDAVVEVSALKRAIPYIVTRNIKDFVRSQVKAILPGEYLAGLKLSGN
jgi:predicted nucleic-acid-binding protein